MGMYTAFHFAGELAQNAPKEVIDVLNYMNTGENKPDVLPDHKFFNTERWWVLFRCDSAYFYATTHCSFIDGCLTVTSNLKDYSNEIEKFIDWIDPYITAFRGEFLGYHRYEESTEPTLIYKK